MAVERKCPKCATWNKEVERCVKCNTIISPRLIEVEREKKREEVRLSTPPSKMDIFVDKWKNSRFLLLRVLYKIVYTIGVIFFALASLFAWMVSAPNG